MIIEIMAAFEVFFRLEVGSASKNLSSRIWSVLCSLARN